MYLILAILSVYYVTKALSDFDGPYGILHLIRKRIGMLHCVFCSTVWISIIPALYLSNNINSFILYTLGIAGAVALIDRGIE